MKRPEPSRFSIPYPNTKHYHLKINAGVCSLTLSPGFGSAWVNGTYTDPRELSPLRMAQTGDVMQITIGDIFRTMIQPRHRPHLDLSFGRQHPFSLSITSGDIDNHFDFGFLPLTGLEVISGAGRQLIDFSYANPQTMEVMRLRAGGGSFHVQNLANANAARINMLGEAANCQLDLGGQISRDTQVHIDMLASNMAINVPVQMAVTVTSTAVPENCQMDGFVYHEKAFWNEMARQQQAPLLNIHPAAAFKSFCINTTGE